MREFWGRSAQASVTQWGEFEPGGWAKPSDWTPELYAPAGGGVNAYADQPKARGRERTEEGPEPRSPAAWTASPA